MNVDYKGICVDSNRHTTTYAQRVLTTQTKKERARSALFFYFHLGTPSLIDTMSSTC